jgi:hypothetical protein
MKSKLNYNGNGQEESNQENIYPKAYSETDPVSNHQRIQDGEETHSYIVDWQITNHHTQDQS